MRNKYKNKIFTEINNKDDKILKLNSTINYFKDINTKKIFIKKQLTLTIDNDIQKEKRIQQCNNNNDLKLYKHVQIRKKLYPQQNNLLSPKFKNIILKMRAIDDDKTSFNHFNCKYKKIIDDLNSEKNTGTFQINIDNINDKSNSLLNTIQVRKKKIENINNNEDEHFNKSINNKNNPVFNYVKKKVIYHGKNNNIINKNNNIKNIENYQNLKKKINSEKLVKQLEINNKTIYYNSSKMKVIGKILSFIPTNYDLKSSYLFFPQKNNDKIYSSKTLEINNEDLKKNNTDININNNKITDITLTKENNLNTDIYDMKQTIYELDNDKNNIENEKRKYIYINRKIRETKNDNAIKNEKEIYNNILPSIKKNKIMEIEVENSNSIQSPLLINENKNDLRYSLTEKKEAIFKNFITFKSKVKPKKFHHHHYKTKNLQKDVKPFQSLKFLVHKAHEIEELGDSFGNFYLSGPSSARNLQYKTKTYNFENDKNNKLSGSHYQLKASSNLESTNNISNNNTISASNKYLKKNIFTNLMPESKKYFKKYINNNNLNEKDNNTINYENKIINNNTFNTTVNFYKIGQAPFESKGANKKNSILLRIKNKYKKEYKNKRATSDLYSKNNNLDKLNSQSQNNYQTGNNIEKNDNSLYRKIQNTSVEENQTKKYEIDLEILYILEAKLKCILNKVNNYNICYNECFDWLNYYFSVNFYDKEINLFKLNHNKNNVMHYIKVELLCYFLCYDVSFNKNFNQAGILLKTIFNLLHINYLILISFILYNDNKNIEESNYCLTKLKEIINKELKVKLNSQDMNENSILLLTSNNFKEISNYYKMIIDNIYSYYYSINNNDKKNEVKHKFRNCLSLNVNTLNTIQKLNIISLFFFDVYRFSNNYNIQFLKNFFELYLYKSKENEALMPFDSLNIKNNFYSVNNNKYNIKNEIYNGNINYNSLNLNKYYLPPIKPYYKYTLVLDLDETLVYFQKDINLYNNNYASNINPTLILRPGLFEFLNKMKPLYELVLFSFGTKDYVDYILSIIEKNGKIFEYVLYRQHATYEKGDYVKNLSLLGRDLKRIIIVDDIPHVFKLQKNNGLCIKAFYGDVISDRNTLKLLGKILEKIRFDAEENDGDIRKSLKKQRNLIFTNITTSLDN